MLSQAEVNALLNLSTPDHLSNSTVPLVAAKSPNIGVMATGTLFQVADYQFIVTAAHSIRGAMKSGVTVGVGCDDNRFKALSGDWITLDIASFVAFEDQVDVAIYKLSTEESLRLKDHHFARVHHTALPRENGIYSVFGYPGVLNSETADNGDLKLKPLSLTLPSPESSEFEIHNHNDRYQFLIAGNSKLSTDLKGVPQSMTDLNQAASNSLRDLKGMSGGPVWLIGTSGSDPEHWKREFPKLVGLQVGVYSNHDLVKATKWYCVLDMIGQNYPELSDALNLSF